MVSLYECHSNFCHCNCEFLQPYYCGSAVIIGAKKTERWIHSCSIMPSSNLSVHEMNGWCWSAGSSARQLQCEQKMCEQKIKALVAKNFLLHSWLLCSQCLYSPKLYSSRRQSYDIPVLSSAFSCSAVQLLISRQAGKCQWPALCQKAQYTQGCNAEESRSIRWSQTEVSRSSYATGIGFISPMQTLQFTKKQQTLKNSVWHLWCGLVCHTMFCWFSQPLDWNWVNFICLFVFVVVRVLLPTGSGNYFATCGSRYMGSGIHIATCDFFVYFCE